MGKRGPAKTPTALTVLRGNPGKRHIPKHEPKPSSEGITCPRWLDSEARKIWREYAPQLIRLGVLTKVDRGAFAQGCRDWAELNRLQKWMKDNGNVFPLIVDNLSKGQPYAKRSRDGRYIVGMQNVPQFTQWRALKTTVERFFARFAMTASDRAGLEVAPKEVEESAFDKFLSYSQNKNAPVRR